MIFDDDELRSNGEEMSIRKVIDDVGELMRSGYYYVESVQEIPDAEDD